MIEWLKKATVDTATAAVNAFNTPAPIGKVILVTGGIAVTVFLVTHKMKVILIFG